MHNVHFNNLGFIPASHENPSDPGVLKKVLFGPGELVAGTVQMVNWAKLLPGKSFAAHYHEDMDEVFVMISGEVEMTVNHEKKVLGRGDAVLVPLCHVHSMKNLTEDNVEYIVFGISRGKNGKTVVLK